MIEIGRTSFYEENTAAKTARERADAAELEARWRDIDRALSNASAEASRGANDVEALKGAGVAERADWLVRVAASLESEARRLRAVVAKAEG